MTVADRKIGGMVHVGVPSRHSLNGERRKYGVRIDPSLRVAAPERDDRGEGAPHWCGYSDLSPARRANHLDWLAGGGEDPAFDPGHLLLHFRGLECRFMFDHPSDDERREIVEEARRLQNVHPDNPAVRSRLENFIEFARRFLDGEFRRERVFPDPDRDVPLEFKISIGERVGKGLPLSADCLLCWFFCHPDARFRAPTIRCADEFRELFRLRFKELYPEGLEVAKPKKVLRRRHWEAPWEPPVGDAVLVDGQAIPDVSAQPKPLEIAQEIADEVTKRNGDLDRLSRYIGRNPAGRDALEMRISLRPELRNMFPTEERERFESWARDRVHAGGTIPAADVIARLKGERPEKPNGEQLDEAVAALARIGYGLAPDPRLGLQRLGADARVTIFELGQTVECLEENVSLTFHTASIELAAGAFVARADGRDADNARKTLRDRAAAMERPSALERRRLFGLLDWMFDAPPDGEVFQVLLENLRDLHPPRRKEIRKIVVAVAQADGEVHPEQVAVLEEIYEALEFKRAFVHSDLHDGEIVPAEEPDATTRTEPRARRRRPPIPRRENFIVPHRGFSGG